MSVVPASIGHHYAVSAGHELAALAAFEVLEGGGNAVDAGVAAILTLGVVYSDQVSIAGVAPMIVHVAESGETWTIAGVGGWPRALDVDAFIDTHAGSIPLGVRRTVVPAAPDACLQALARWGTMRYRDVAARAVQYATEGFARHQVMLDYVRQYADDFRQWPDNVAIWMPDGEVPTLGDRLVQADLGATLQFLCDEEQAAGDDRSAGLEAVRKAFYRGDIAAHILAHQRAHDGLLAADDLEQFSCQILPSLSRRIRLDGDEVEVHTCGAWCQGPMLLEALAMVEGLNMQALGHNSDAYLHTVAEVLKLAFADRESYLGDPDFVHVPIDALIGEAYAAEQRKRIDPHTASPGMPHPGAIPGFAPYVSPVSVADEPARLPADTSIVAVVDEKGNALCSTPSDTSWDTPVVPGTGLAVSSRGAQSWAVRGHPSCIAPGKRPRLTPNPCFATVPGRWIMPFGTPGGDAQVQASLQMLLNHLGFGMSLQDAIEAPRLMTHSHPNSFAPHHAEPGRVTLEGRIAEDVTEQLASRGHRVDRLEDWTHWVAGLCAVKKDLVSGQLEAGADPRRWSRAMAW
jgi:gamma-glutamyltranspeptidase/glutathione hydrolase